MIKKRYIKDIEDGDTFAWKIESEDYPEFNSRYLILTYYYNENYEESKSKMFRAKITKDYIIPRDVQDLESLENVITTYNIYDFVMEEYQEAKNVIPDSYGYIYQYTFSIYIDRKTLPKKMLDLGNFSLKDIPNEFYVPEGTRDQESVCWKYLEDNLLYDYVLYNQKQFIGYTEEGNKEVYKNAYQNAEVQKFVKVFLQKMRSGEQDNILKKLGIDIENEVPTDDSLTYVGPDDESTKDVKKS